MTIAQLEVMKALAAGGRIESRFAGPVVIPAGPKSPRWVASRQTFEALVRKRWIERLTPNADEANPAFGITEIGRAAFQKERYRARTA